MKAHPAATTTVATATAKHWRYSPECSIYVGGLEGEDEIWPEQHPGELSHGTHGGFWRHDLCVLCKAVRAFQGVRGGRLGRELLCAQQLLDLLVTPVKTKKVYWCMHRFRLEPGEASLYQD